MHGNKRSNGNERSNGSKSSNDNKKSQWQQKFQWPQKFQNVTLTVFSSQVIHMGLFLFAGYIYNKEYSNCV